MGGITMRSFRMRLEPLALLVTIICICMCVLALLSFATSMADQRIAFQHGETVRIRYELEEAGQRFLKELSRSDDTGIINRELEKDGYRLSIEVLKEDDEMKIRTWKIVKIGKQDENIGGLREGE